MESFKPKRNSLKETKEKLISKAPEVMSSSEKIDEESVAERELTELLGMKENEFLHEPINQSGLDNCATSKEALTFALQKIIERDRRTFRFTIGTNLPGVNLEELSFESLRENIKGILRNAIEIGKGGDGAVVIDKNEIRSMPPEICYKFAIEEKVLRGRNSTTVETKLQEQFYRASLEQSESKIGIPMPFYSMEMGAHKMIAMEKLNAASVDDILHGKGTLPPWLDVNEFCDEIEKTITHLHAKGLYHRDMHMGNVMISQAKELVDGQKIGYIIDFGLSLEDTEGLEPYKKEVAGRTFTYSDDYGILQGVRNALRVKQNKELPS